MSERTETDVEPSGYADLLADLKLRVRQTQLHAARAANTEVMRLYWSIGHDLLQRQRSATWGSGVIARLAADLKREFPDQRGWSATNLKYMRMAAEAWPTLTEFGQQAVDQLPWGHVIALLTKLGDSDDRAWYAARAVDEGWSRSVLLHHIAVGTRAAVGAAPANFADTLDPVDSDLARDLVKDP